MTWSIQPVCHYGWIAAAALVLLAAVAWGSRILHGKNITTAWIARLAVLRVLAVLIVALILLRPSIHYRREVDVRPDRLILLDTSASMNLPDAVGGVSRLENVLSHLREPGLREALLDPYENHWYAFDSYARALEYSELDSIRADGTDTRIGSAIEEALNLYRWSFRHQETEKSPPRILLISDGLDRGRLDPLLPVMRHGLAVDVMSPSVVPDPHDRKIEISDVQHSRRLLLGSELRMQVAVRQTGFADVPVRLLLESGEKVIQSRTLRFSEQQSERRLTINHRPDHAGFKRYTLRFETDESELQPVAEASAGREITVRVESHHHEVLVIEPEWRWEFKFLRRVLESDPGFAFTGFLSRGPGIYLQFGEPHRRVSLGGFPRSRAELEGFDTFILGDAHPGRLPPQLPEALHDLVMRQGKSMVVIAGPEIGAWSRNPYLSALLPVELYAGSSGPIEGPVPIRVSVEGQASPFFFAPDDAPSVRRWPELPPMFQIYAPLRKKPAATILLETPAHRNEFGNLIVAAVHTAGRGQVLYIATDTLWKWQMQGVTDDDGNTPYRVFWQQAFRAIRPERLGAAAVNLWLIPDRTHAQAGQTVTVQAHVESDVSVSDVRVTGRMRLPDDRSLPLLFTRDAEAPDRFVCRFEASEAGFYEIHAEVFADGQSAGEAVTAVDVMTIPDETTPIPPNPGLLEQLASASGGVRVDPQNIDLWRSATSVAPTITEVREKTLNLWSNLWLILALTLVLGADWIIRLMRGYV